MGNAKKKQKIIAIKLRKLGWSYGEIRTRLRVSKSTLSFWLKGIPLKPEDRLRLYTRQVGILNAGAQSQKLRREREVLEIVEQAKTEISKPIHFDSYRLFGAALYWAEGSKGRMFQMTNSDPSLILFWVKWLKRIFNIPASMLKAKLNIYPQQSEKNIKLFWSELTGIPLKNFGKSYVKPLSKNYKTNNLYYGTIRIEVPKSTDLRHRVYGWTRVILDSIAPNVKLTEQRWGKLKTVARPINLG